LHLNFLIWLYFVAKSSSISIRNQMLWCFVCVHLKFVKKVPFCKCGQIFDLNLITDIQWLHTVLQHRYFLQWQIYRTYIETFGKLITKRLNWICNWIELGLSNWICSTYKACLLVFYIHTYKLRILSLIRDQRTKKKQGKKE